jgi:hypothetical protein
MFASQTPCKQEIKDFRPTWVTNWVTKTSKVNSTHPRSVPSNREVVELCLSHVPGDPLELAYQRGNIIEKRRQLIQAWADYCDMGELTGQNVVPLRA